jgi:hypothetical protein
MLALQPLTPVIVKVVPAATPQVSVLDVLVGSFGLLGMLAAGAAVLGLVFGGALIGYHRWKFARLESSEAASDTTRLDLSSPPR